MNGASETERGVVLVVRIPAAVRAPRTSASPEQRSSPECPDSLVSNDSCCVLLNPVREILRHDAAGSHLDRNLDEQIYVVRRMYANVKRAVILLLVLSLFLGNVTSTSENDTKPISLSDSVGLVASLSNQSENDAFKQRINLAPFNRLKITVTDVPSDIWFIVLQIHTFQYDATLSYDKELLDKVSNGSLFGSNIGLYLNTHNATAPIQVFLKHDNVNDLDALLVIVTYGQNAPIPGGCNTEFDIEVSPYQKHRTEYEVVTVDTLPASVLALDGSPISCEKSAVQYKLYRLYLSGPDFTPDTYFDAIASMLTAQDIAQNGDEIPIFSGTVTHVTDVMLTDTASGTGTIYATAAIYENYSSAYVPIFMYACNHLPYLERYQVLNDTITKLLVLSLILKCIQLVIEDKYVYIGLLCHCTIFGTSGYALARLTDFSHGISILIGLICTVPTMICLARLSVRLSEDLRCYMLWLRNLTISLVSAYLTYLYTPASPYRAMFLAHRWSFWIMVILMILLIIIVVPVVVTYLEDFIAYAMDNIDIKLVTWMMFGLCLLVGAFNYYCESNNITFIIRGKPIPGFHLACAYPFGVSYVNLILSCSFPTIILLVRRYASSLLPTKHNDDRFSPKKNELKC